MISFVFFIICRFIYMEYKLAARKRGEMQMDFTWEDAYYYRLDFYLSSNAMAKPVILLGGTFVLIVIGSSLLASAAKKSLSSCLWLSWTYVADPGTHADAEGTLVRFVSLVITIGGMVIFAFMVGLISESIGEKLDELKKGKSRVIESNHTLILGWNDKILAIIQQIALANESEGGGIIVVIANKEKEEMEETLLFAMNTTENGMDLLGSIVVFRSGNPLMEHDLAKVSVPSARSIIALSNENEDPDESDSMMVRQILALKAFGSIRCHVVVELQDIDNKSSILQIAPDIAEAVVTNDIIGRLMIQCAREPGLAYVLESLIGFEGDEFYTEYWPDLEGKTFTEITCRFDDAVPVGVKEPNGNIIINPSSSYVIGKGCFIICLAEDNDTYTINDGKYDVKRCGRIPEQKKSLLSKEKMLFCGWRRDMADLITQLDEYVVEGSELWLFNTVAAREREDLLKDKGNKEPLQLRNLSIKNVVGDPIIRRDLLLLKAVDYEGKPTGESYTLHEFDSILILADSIAIEKGADIQTSDSRALTSLLSIQDLQFRQYEEKKALLGNSDSQLQEPRAPIGEILDRRTRNLLSICGCKAFIMSNEIISASIAQIAEDRDMNVIFTILLTSEGSETHIKKISTYMDVDTETHLSFWDIALRARQRGEVAIGYKPASMSWEEATNLILNPPNKSQLINWHEDDVVILFSED
eukprot:CAMPEP_0172505778 /NCGR_PEP_ID=MMETSP1066-20121228/188898_1 /TAXON_ID=671091 /ORGANISM="Coscinodiscus wailesii, Strain CCMP2513" /LENGTH=698 /DNA_ID=CAMNT_0013282515 /DNA_START=263 /DNA_END=2359 /DNA_ORIENTATION=-